MKTIATFTDRARFEAHRRNLIAAGYACLSSVTYTDGTHAAVYAKGNAYKQVLRLVLTR